MLRAERAEKNVVCIPNCDILGVGPTLVANKVKKISNEFVWGQDGSFGGKLPRAPSWLRHWLRLR